MIWVSVLDYEGKGGHERIGLGPILYPITKVIASLDSFGA
jgi:hypothetical protein